LCWDRPGSNPFLCVGGSFSYAGEVPVRNVVAWDGAQWLAMGECPIVVSALAVYDPDGAGPAPEVLVAAGRAEEPGYNGLAAWDGTQWSSMGGGVSSSVEALAAYDEDGPGPQPCCLFAAGTFMVGGIARWNGMAWSALPHGPDLGNNTVLYALAVSAVGNGAPKLYLGGGFATVNGASANGLASWDGTSWAAVRISGQPETTHMVVALHPASDGGQEVLYIAGGFYGPQTQPWQLLRWNGTTALPLIEDWSNVLDLAHVDEDGVGPLPPALYAAGAFSVMGGVPSSNIARLGCDPCYANCDGSTAAPILTVLDFVCFQSRYVQGDPLANCDGSTASPVLNVNDFLCFLNRYAQGCP
jgi:trimeric autotransporter adhesin